MPVLPAGGPAPRRWRAAPSFANWQGEWRRRWLRSIFRDAGVGLVGRESPYTPTNPFFFKWRRNKINEMKRRKIIQKNILHPSTSPFLPLGQLLPMSHFFFFRWSLSCKFHYYSYVIRGEEQNTAWIYRFLVSLVQFRFSVLLATLPKSEMWMTKRGNVFLKI